MGVKVMSYTAIVKEQYTVIRTCQELTFTYKNPLSLSLSLENNLFLIVNLSLIFQEFEKYFNHF